MASRSGSALSEDDLKRISGQYDLESVRRLNLRDMGLVDVSVLAGCTEMVALDLRGNKVRVSLTAGLPMASVANRFNRCSHAAL